jgi:glycosyltransferase involved in cell wall biosynthesis
MVMPKISAIVCTHNRAAFLPAALDSLLRQSVDPEAYEIIVVDNLSTDETPSVTQSYVREHANLRCIVEPKLGLSVARNAGMQQTAAELVAFTDDDAVVAPDWIERLLERFSKVHAMTAAIGGEIEPIWQVPRPGWLTDAMLRPLSAHLGWSDQPIVLGKGQWLCEVNCAYRRELVLGYGGFPTSLGRQGGNLLSGEGTINERLQADGYELFFDPRIRVRHTIHAERVSRDWFRRRYFWQGVTEAVTAEERQRLGTPPEHWQILDLPQSPDEWVTMFDDLGDDDEFEAHCNRLAHLGYLLTFKGLVGGNR